MSERPEVTPGTGARTAGRSDGVILLVIVALGALLRLPGLWQFDAWQDEIYSIFEARDLIHSPFGPGGIELRPLYFLALHPLAKAMPHALVLLRLPSFIFGLLGIAATWTLARRTLGRNAAIVAAGVLAVLPLHIDASQTIRYWSLIYLLGALFTGSQLRAMTSDSRRDHLLVLTWLLIGTLTHPTFAITAVGMTVAAHLVDDTGHLTIRWPTAGAWRLTWMPAVVLLLGVLHRALAVLHDRTARGRSGRLAQTAAARAGLQPLARSVDREYAGCTVAAVERDPTLRPARSHDGPRRRHFLVPRCSLADTCSSCPCRCCTSRRRFQWCFPPRARCAPESPRRRLVQRRTAIVLLLVLAAAIAPSTVSQLVDGSRFDYRPALSHITADDPRGTVVMWPRVQAMWATPALESIELRGSTPVSMFDSLDTSRDRFWVITSERRYGFVGDAGGRKQRWLARHCDKVLTTGKARYDFEQYVAMLWECRATGPAPMTEPDHIARPLPDRD